MTRRTKLSASAARRIALAAQGFAAERADGETNAGHVRRVIDRLGLLQMDSVNVLTRAHYLPLFSRLGNYDSTHLDSLAWGRKSKRGLFEFWAHEASLLPVTTHPLWRWKMHRMREATGGCVVTGSREASCAQNSNSPRLLLRPHARLSRCVLS